MGSRGVLLSLCFYQSSLQPWSSGHLHNKSTSNNHLYSFWKQCFELPKLSCFVTVLTYRWDLLAPYLALPAVFPYPEGIFHRTIREVQPPRKSPWTPCSKCYRSIGMRKGFVLLCSARSGWSASSSMCFRHSRRGSEKVCHLDKSLRKGCKYINNILPLRKLMRHKF